MEKTNIIWLRRDLRIEDNNAVQAASVSSNPCELLFIFDENIVSKLPSDDSRINFIYQQLKKLAEQKIPLIIEKGNPTEVWKKLIAQKNIEKIFYNEDFEPYAVKRDAELETIWKTSGIISNKTLDHLFFHPKEILKKDGNPYTVFTPYKKKWLETYDKIPRTKLEDKMPVWRDYLPTLPSLQALGFKTSSITVENFNIQKQHEYTTKRDFPIENIGSKLGPHLRFGTVSVRKMIKEISNPTLLSEIIWRSFFAQIIYHFPESATENFRSKYDGIQWRNNKKDFERWCQGKTGYPLVDAGMRELNSTGYMHNRVRMITASFLCKHLLIDWRWGERYFAEKLLDFDLASNVGNWQWSAGTGCDAAPYFRIFNPIEQQKKFDKNLDYCKKWIPEIALGQYYPPIVDHKFARARALETYKKGIE